MNSLLASNINGGFNNQQIANGSTASILSSFIDFTVTETMTNQSSSQPDKPLIKLATDTEDNLCNGQQGKSQSKLKETEDIFCNGQQGKSLLKFKDTEDILRNGQNKVKIYDQNKNTLENYVAVNGNNKDKSPEDTIPVPKVQLFTGKVHAEWYQVHKIGAGLVNLGNTCFMNTVIQCLTYCPPLANYLLHDSDHASKCTITGFCMMCLLQKHMKKVIGKTGDVIKPFDIFQRLKLIAKHFQYNRQEDAHEFLRYVIDHLWKSCLIQVNGVKLDSASKETTVINKIFGGYHRSQVICLRCKKKSNTYDHFMDIILDVKQNVASLDKALEKYIQPELLQQENSYKCPKCKMKVEAQKRFSVFQPPVVATFQFKRFDYNRSFGGKITKQIYYPEKLNLRPYMSETQGDPVMYYLNAVLVHSGPSCNSGHYYCYVKNSNGYWYIMDDSRVQQTNLTNVLNQSAYVLFYVKRENIERAPLKKCLDNKNTYMKGTMSNSHFSKVSEVNNLMKPIPLSDSNSSFCNSKPYNSPNNVKKFNFSSPNRDKISFSFRPGATSTQLSSPKSKLTTSESDSASVKQSGLVPYMEDSSESSDASESIINNDIKHLSKVSSADNYKVSPQLEVKRKLSKCASKPYSSVNNTPHKVSATDSWIVTDAPQTSTSSGSNSSGVNSTTDWTVIEASDLPLLKSPSSLKENKNSVKESLGSLKESKNNSVKGYLSPTKESKNNGVESLGSNKISISEMSPPKHLENPNEGSHDVFSSAKMSNNYESSPSSENGNFRKQIPKSKLCFSEEDETSNSFKRKYCDSNSKIFKDSPHSEHGENRHSPLPKKIKYAENSSYLNLESDVRNSESKNKNNNNSCASSTVQQRQYASNCDNSRTHMANGVSHFSDNTGVSPNKNSYSSPMKSTLNNPETDRLLSKGNQDKSSEYCNNYSHEKDKLPISDRGHNGFLFGTEVPTWREENHYRPTLNSGHEVRRTFDGYDNELDRGKVRKSKAKDRYHYFHQKNPFQKHTDNRYHGKFNRRHYNSHQNFRKFDSRPNWKPNHRNNYQRYHNQHHRY